ncbi:hypothetical protein, partial [Xylanibacter rodentium]|uniref:hypothetical protein n=1 Tax=Xylanibacter rodentium TaxID=2736289 RepID=UPI002594515C
IHACHAWGHGFESRTHRQLLRGFRANALKPFLLYIIVCYDYFKNIGGREKFYPLISYRLCFMANIDNFLLNLL